MSKKLLNEEQVRKFMKLANIPSLASEFVERNNLREEEAKSEQPVEETEVVEEAKVDSETEEVNEEEETVDEMAHGDKEADRDDDMKPEGEDAVEDMLKKFIEAGAQAVGLDISVEDDEMGEEPPMDEPPMDEPEEEGEADRYGMMEEEDLASAIAERVYDRIMKESKNKKVAEKLDVEELARRVAKRLVEDTEKQSEG